MCKAVSNEDDGRVARGQRLVAFGGGAILVVNWLQVGESTESGVVTITAQVQDDVAVVTATVKAYPPGMTVPYTGEGETPMLPVERVELRDDEREGVYEGFYTGFA